MAVLRDRPYAPFNFLVDLGDGATEGPQAGFQEVSGLSTEVSVIEYRNGNSKENGVMKITGLNKATDVTLKRGVMGSLGLYAWLDQIRNGDQGDGGPKAPHARRAAAGKQCQLPGRPRPGRPGSARSRVFRGGAAPALPRSAQPPSIRGSQAAGC
jgi:phage tail-like protein